MVKNEEADECETEMGRVVKCGKRENEKDELFMGR
jgi:hypothetical protein